MQIDKNIDQGQGLSSISNGFGFCRTSNLSTDDVSYLSIFFDIFKYAMRLEVMKGTLGGF